ncbi:MAG: hypothetical protein [Microviridae sp.]|nr:MAG: hypothetical protein [Microviridae sp.]
MPPNNFSPSTNSIPKLVHVCIYSSKGYLLKILSLAKLKRKIFYKCSLDNICIHTYLCIDLMRGKNFLCLFFLLRSAPFFTKCMRVSASPAAPFLDEE